ncbi:MAG: hypothetical protein A2138_10325 [Deltaproteobacteria bacterium RBG_16_71_12]|nr:MAG: hypothetical protein A2138_10325 [Deltaproteobacteria bacterium RBG_16_71_12]
MVAASFPPTPLDEGSVRALLVRLAARGERSGVAQWELAVDHVTRRLRELEDPAEFEELCAGWRPRLAELVDTAGEGVMDADGVRDLNVIITAIECQLEHLTGPNGLEGADLRLSYHSTDAARLVRTMSAAFRGLAGRRGIRFTVDLPDEALVDVDPAKLETIVLALLYNAFKHTPMRGSIRCTLHLGGPDELMVLSVVDSSPRIGAVESAALFAGGVHDRSATFDLAGRTVGLGTARDFARVHGGWLVLRETEKRRGCIFEVALPARAPRGIPVAAAEAQQARSSVGEAVADQVRHELDAEAHLGEAVTRDERPLALIVEDNPHTQRILALTLQPAYAVAAAFDGQDGVAKAIALKPDVIITDVRMPNMDGEAMVHAIREQEDLSDVPILVLTATDDHAVIVRLLEAGVEDVLRKPFEIPEVRARVRALVAAKRARDTLNSTIGHQEDNLVALAEEVASRQRGLEQAMRQLEEERDRARRADRVKGNFLRMMSHELKTPLAALHLQLHLLERGVGGGAGSGAADGLARMRRSVRRLTLLIETMTEWARVADGRFVTAAAPVVLADLVRGVVDETRGAASNRGVDVSLETAELPPLQADARLASLLIENLLSFAVQLCERGTVALATAAVGDAQQLRLRCPAVPGGDDVAGDDVFSAFTDDGDIGARSGAGSGLGLRVVRDIARAVGGDLVQSPSSDRAALEFVMTWRPNRELERRGTTTLNGGGRHADAARPQRRATP